MAYCPNCGEEVKPDAMYCSECGEALGDKSSSQPTESSDDGKPTADFGSAGEHSGGIDWTRVVKAGGFALVPAFIAYMALSLVSGGDPVGIVFFVALPVFGYLLYQQAGTKAMIGGMCYYLALEFLLSPLVFLIYTFVFTSENTTTGAEQVGAAIGGFVLVIASFVIGLPLALALYLVSRRLTPADGSADTAA